VPTSEEFPLVVSEACFLFSSRRKATRESGQPATKEKVLFLKVGSHRRDGVENGIDRISLGMFVLRCAVIRRSNSPEADRSRPYGSESIQLSLDPHSLRSRRLDTIPHE